MPTTKTPIPFTEKDREALRRAVTLEIDDSRLVLAGDLILDLCEEMTRLQNEKNGLVLE